MRHRVITYYCSYIGGSTKLKKGQLKLTTHQCEIHSFSYK